MSFGELSVANSFKPTFITKRFFFFFDRFSNHAENPPPRKFPLRKISSMENFSSGTLLPSTGKSPRQFSSDNSFGKSPFVKSNRQRENKTNKKKNRTGILAISSKKIYPLKFTSGNFTLHGKVDEADFDSSFFFQGVLYEMGEPKETLFGFQVL